MSCPAPTIATTLRTSPPQWYDPDAYSCCSDRRERCAMEELLRSTDGCHRLLQRLHASAASHADKEMLFLALRCLMDGAAQSSDDLRRARGAERAASVARLAAVTSQEAAAAALWSLRRIVVLRPQPSNRPPLPAPSSEHEGGTQFSLLDALESHRPHGSSLAATPSEASGTKARARAGPCAATDADTDADADADADCSNSNGSSKGIFGAAARKRNVRVRLNGGDWVQLRRGGSRNRVAIAHQHELALLAGQGQGQDQGQDQSHDQLQHRHRLVAEERSVLQVLAGRQSVLPFKVLKGDVVGFVFAVEEHAGDVGFSLKKRERAVCAAGSSSSGGGGGSSSSSSSSSSHSSPQSGVGGNRRDSGDASAVDAGSRALPDLPWLGMPATPLPGAPFGSNGYLGTEKAPRYGRDGDVVRGAWGPALQSCELLFCWCNRHSKIRAKTVSFTIRCWAEECDSGT